ncbi:MAG: hypothetical protein IJ607_03380 [Bacteroidaceae bacterium]|nr:hypothetical protein [Bacteroidaceae bacterium]
MDALQLNAEIYRAMSEIAEDETLMNKALKYIKKLAAQKKDSSLMSKEEFFAKVDEAKEQIKKGEYTRFSDPATMNLWLNSL